ncbi:lymphocyte cytosolic protein 2-like [Uloborus diversus]|uniref:lymphocyte cytosolic protein 2-like n=1 Tax=Uloborus diversus TaxID=327109 RepID=UPI0024090952|nr:lymphocyte cytosolic protein 2-like [Uloborus diversus]
MEVHLDDCIPAFEVRHIDGAKLLELTEQKLFTYQDLKIKHRKQIAKCVQECKSQASNAKRMARILKQQHSRSSRVGEADFNGAYESDSDDWGSDFEDDSDDEVRNENLTAELNNNTLHSLGHSNNEMCCSTQKPCSKTVFECSPGKSIPKPPDVPVIPKSMNSLSGPKSSHSGIPRPPSKRPPSHPPPPPVLLVSSQDEPQEDYEIPIVSTSKSGNAASLSIRQTYELIEPPEEDYEVVDDSLSPVEKPVLPPRNPVASSSPPPPLPQKPRKLKDPVFPDKPEEIRGFTRTPKESPIQESTLERLGRKMSNSSFQGSREAESLSSRSSSPEKDAAQNMATRPLPPVPISKEEKVNSKQPELQSCPWFCEMEREDAEQVVRGLEETGSFVVRPSKRAGQDNPYSLTVLHDCRLFHLNIRRRSDDTFALGKEKKKEKTFPTVADLISYHQAEPILLTSRGEPAGKTILTKYPEKPST